MQKSDRKIDLQNQTCYLKFPDYKAPKQMSTLPTTPC